MALFVIPESQKIFLKTDKSSSCIKMYQEYKVKHKESGR